MSKFLSESEIKELYEKLNAPMSQKAGGLGGEKIPPKVLNDYYFTPEALELVNYILATMGGTALMSCLILSKMDKQHDDYNTGYSGLKGVLESLGELAEKTKYVHEKVYSAFLKALDGEEIDADSL